MANDGILQGKNQRYLPAGVIDVVVDVSDDYIYINSSTSAVRVYLPNIKNSGLDFNRKDFYISDYSGNAAINNITIYPSGNNTINSTSSAVISNNNGTAVCQISTPTEYNVLVDGSIDGPINLASGDVIGILPAAKGGSGVNNGIKQVTFPYTNGILALANSVGYNVKEYGLVGDGVTDDRAALNTLLNTTAPTGSTIFFPPGNYLIGSNIAVTDKQFFLCGAFASISITANTQILTISSTVAAATKWKIENLLFVGSGAGANQYGLYFSDNSGGFVINNCSFTSFGGGGIGASNTETSDVLGGIISNCKFTSNGVGLDLFTRAEYVQVVACDFILNTKGVQAAGGTFIITGCNITYNTTGVEVITGANNGHAIINACNINHNVTFGLNIHDTALGMTISANHIYENPIRIKDTTGVNISGGEIDVTAYTLDTNVGLIFSGVRFSSSYANTVTLTGAAPQYNSCYHIDGRAAANPTTFNAETVASGAANLTMSPATRFYVFTGTTSTWTLYALTAASLNRPVLIKNRGSGNLTINTVAAGNDIYDTAAVNTLVVGAGATVILNYDGTFFNVD